MARTHKRGAEDAGRPGRKKKSRRTEEEGECSTNPAPPFNVFLNEFREARKKKQLEKGKQRETGMDAEVSDSDTEGETVQKMAQDAWANLSQSERDTYSLDYRNQVAAMKENSSRSGQRVVQQRTKRSAPIRCSPWRLGQLVKSLTEEKKEAVVEMGFGGLLHVEAMKLPSKIVQWIAENFNPWTCELKLDGGKWTVKETDVHAVFGLPISGPLPTECPKQKIPRDTKRLLKAKELQKELEEMEVGPEFRIKFLLFVCGCFLTPTSKLDISTMLWPHLVNVEVIKTLNWCRYVLDCLCIQLQHWKSGSGDPASKWIGGCVYFLAVLYFDRVDIRHHRVCKTSPAMRAWTKKAFMERCSLELRHHGKFGRGKPGQPYSISVESHLTQTSRGPDENAATIETPRDAMSALEELGLGELALSMRAMFSSAFELAKVPITKGEVGRQAVESLIADVLREKHISLLVDGRSSDKKAPYHDGNGPGDGESEFVSCDEGEEDADHMKGEGERDLGMRKDLHLSSPTTGGGPQTAEGDDLHLVGAATGGGPQTMEGPDPQPVSPTTGDDIHPPTPDMATSGAEEGASEIETVHLDQLGNASANLDAAPKLIDPPILRQTRSKVYRAQTADGGPAEGTLPSSSRKVREHVNIQGPQSVEGVDPHPDSPASGGDDVQTPTPNMPTNGGEEGASDLSNIPSDELGNASTNSAGGIPNLDAGPKVFDPPILRKTRSRVYRARTKEGGPVEGTLPCSSGKDREEENIQVDHALPAVNSQLENRQKLGE